MVQTGKYKYKAAISFAYEDMEKARRLCAALKNFSIPQEFVGSVGADGLIGSNFSPIYFNRQRRAEQSNLDNDAIEALKLSKFLIVLGSDKVASSQYVSEEIQMFLSWAGGAI